MTQLAWITSTWLTLATFCGALALLAAFAWKYRLKTRSKKKTRPGAPTRSQESQLNENHANASKSVSGMKESGGPVPPTDEEQPARKEKMALDRLTVARNLASGANRVFLIFLISLLLIWIQRVAEYSLKALANSRIGPYDVHELLHEYQMPLGALPDAHVLFSSSMAEAMKEIGEADDYAQAIKNMKDEAPRLVQRLRDGKVPAAKQCAVAETQVEESVYLENGRSVYAFYRKLVISRNPDVTDRQVRFNRMFYLVSGRKPEVRTFLTQYCGKF